MTSIPRSKAYAGPTLLSYGFRPFFLLGAFYAGLTVLIWMPVFMGDLALSTAFSPLDWHIHEMVYGYLPALITGFLLTAIPNWTGRLPIQGKPLLLVLLWIAGRVAVTTSAVLDWLPAAAIDAAFLLLVMAAAAREVLAGHNWRNLNVVVLLVLFAAGNIGFHLEAHVSGGADVAARLGLAVAVILIMLIGGRVIPSFTRNWLVRQNIGRLPAPFSRFDVAAIGTGAVALLAWVVMPQTSIAGGVLALAGILHCVRLVRWAGDRTLRERLVLVLHVGYAFVPIGFLLSACGAFGVLTPAAGIHAWGTGAVGLMTLAVMTRASLGHTGGVLAASGPTQAIYAAVLLAAVARIAAALIPARMLPLLSLAAVAWACAFLAFVGIYGPRLIWERPAGA